MKISRIIKIIIFFLSVSPFIAVPLHSQMLMRARTQYSKAEVIEVSSAVPAGMDGAETVLVKFLSGEFKGGYVEVKNLIWNREEYNVRVERGDYVTVRTDFRPFEMTEFYISGRWRSPWVFISLALFFLIFLFCAGFKRWTALLALVLNVAVIFAVIIPLLKAGWPPFLTVLILQGITGGITLRVILGGGKKLVCALAGVVAGVAAGGVLALEFAGIMNMSGVFFPGARMLQSASRYLSGWNVSDFRGLFSAGVMIASMGAVADVAVTVSSGCWEVALKSERISAGDIWKSGINIGRDIIATMLNSLVIAFTALALPVISVFYLLEIPFIKALNFEFFTALASSALIASIALVLTVPVTASACGIIFKKE